MVDNLVDSSRQLSITAFKNLKKLINSDFSWPQGPSSEFASDLCWFIHYLYTIYTYIIQIQYINSMDTIQNSMDTIQIQYRRSCIGLYLFELLCIGMHWSVWFLIIDSFDSESMGTRVIGTGNKSILSVFGKRNTSAGVPTYRVRTLPVFSWIVLWPTSFSFQQGAWHCMPHEDRR